MGVQAVPQSGRWAVRRAGAGRAIRAGLTEVEAWRLARDAARADGVAAYRFGANGRITEVRRPGA